MSKPMQSFVDLDSVTFQCPCGAQVTGEGDRITQFVQDHKAHTDGTCCETVTDDGARVYTEKPAPRTYNLT